MEELTKSLVGQAQGRGATNRPDGANRVRDIGGPVWIEAGEEGEVDRDGVAIGRQLSHHVQEMAPRSLVESSFDLDGQRAVVPTSVEPEEMLSLLGAGK